MNAQPYDAVIIGGGACGLMCAVQAGFIGKRTLILEKNPQVGAKIAISGGGRCNYTNLHTSASNFISNNPHFSKSALSQWTVEDTIAFFEMYGILGHEKTLGQLFPQSNKAKDIVNLFLEQCLALDQHVTTNAQVKDVIKHHQDFEVIYEINGHVKQVYTSKIVVASGGLPIPKMGATDFGLRLAKKFGLTVTNTAPALVPLTITGKDEQFYANLSGISIFAKVSLEDVSFEENILFTHWGLSGPAILQISSYWRPGLGIVIDFLPNKKIRDLIEIERSVNGKRLTATFLTNFFSKRFVEAIAEQLPIHKNLASLSNDDLNLIAEFIHFFKVKPAGDKGYEKAEVMRGGVSTEELSSKTLESKKIPGLYFGGECIDVTGWLGGYNFQWAWACGYVIAQQL